MAEFRVPELGENVAGGDVTRVMVTVGDTIAREQPVLEIETDKATVEVPSSVAGRVASIDVKQGDTVKVGDLVLIVEDCEPRTPSSEPRTPSPIDQNVVSMPARPAPPPSTSARPNPESRIPNPEPRTPSPGRRAPAAPGVRRLAREVGVEIDDVQGTGPQGRISQEDVKEHARRILSSGGPSTPIGAGSRGASERDASLLPDFERWGDVERVPMSNIRRITSERLGHAWDVIPHVTQFDKADITAMETVRKKYREQVQSAGGNLTVTAMLVKVIAAAVKQFPQFNASLDPQANEIIYKKYVNVGVAVDTDRGLLVPVIRHADQKNMTEIAVEVHKAAEKARGRTLTLEEMSGGGITISNLGGIGGTYFTPIVNWPEVAILGVSRGIVEPVWVPGASMGRPSDPSSNAPTGAFQARQLLPLSLSYDHRVIDGADAMRFLRWVVEAIEQPFLLSLFG